MLKNKMIRMSVFSCILLFRAESTKAQVGSFDIQDKDIGFIVSPNPVTPACILPQIVFGATTTIYHGSVVEPSIAVNPKHKSHMVAVFQQDRINNGGALDLGIVHSKDGGKKWEHSIMPFQNCNGGFIQRITDPWLSYSSDGKRVYLIALPFNATQDINTQNQEGIVVSVSQDNGKTWSNPHFVASSFDYLNEPTGSFPEDDKPTITADPNFKKNAYAVWNRYPTVRSFHADTLLSRTTNGGISWSDNHIIYNPFPDLTAHNMSNGIYNDCETVGNLIVGLPNDLLLNFMTRIYAAPGATDQQYIDDVWPYQFTLFDIAVISSIDQGLTWTQNATQVATMDGNNTFSGGYTYNNAGQITGGAGDQIRTSVALMDANVNPHNGNVYVVWQSGQFRQDQLPQIALSTSRDGGVTWSNPVKINRTPPFAANPQAFTPAVAVTKDGYVGILYNDFRNNITLDPNNTNTDVWFAIYKEVSNPNGGSTGIGLDFIREVRVSKKSYIMQNGPNTTTGIMTNGDYSQVVAQGDDFFAIYVKSNNGPFAPEQVILDDEFTGTVLLLDNNTRTVPYFSKIDA
jgi:hypothetical protein